MPENHLNKQLLSEHRFFSAFSSECQQRFLSDMGIKIFRKNTTLFSRGDKADTVYLVINGWVKIYRVTSEGEEVVVSLLTKGDIFPKLSILGDDHYHFSAITLEDSSIASFSLSDIRKELFNDKNAMENMLQMAAKSIQGMILDNEHLSIMSAPQRVGCLILRFLSDSEDKYRSEIPYDKALAASQLGMKPETFSRAMAQLREVGVTSKGSIITIEDLNKLSDYCCSHCSITSDHSDCCRSGCCCDYYKKISSKAA